MKHTKSIRYEILKPIDEDITWKIFGEMLKNTSYDTMLVSNKLIQILYEDFRRKRDYYEIYKANCPDKDIDVYGCSLQGYLYREAVKFKPHISSLNISQTVALVNGLWKKTVKELRKFQASPPAYKLGTPIAIKGDNYKITELPEHKYRIDATLFSKQHEGRSRYAFQIKAFKGSQQAIIDRLISGNYKQGAALIQQIKNKWYINMAYTFESSETENINSDMIMGIDLGMSKPAVWAFSDSNPKWFGRYNYIDGKQIIEFRKGIEARRKDMLRIAGATGHGRKRKMKPTEHLSGKVEDFKNTINHKYSRKIVDEAIKHKCGVIQMENLSGVSENEAFLKYWTYFDLQTKIKYKAAEAGIEVRMIEPEYTSQRCSVCGFIHKENRLSQEQFKCLECGYEQNADYNAARNIAIEGIEDIITKTTGIKRKKKKVA